MSKGKNFLYFCLSFVGGIFISSLVSIPKEFLWGFFVFGLILIFTSWRNKRFVVVGFCLILFAFGILRHQQALTGISELASYNDRGVITIWGVVSADPDVRIKSTQLKIKSSAFAFTFANATADKKATADKQKLKVDDGYQNISGNFLVTVPRYPEYKYGDELGIIGKLETPAEDIEGFNYENYLSKDGIYSVMSFPKINKISEGKGNIVYSYIFNFKHALRDSIYKAIPSPHSDILVAILFGEQRRIPEDLLDAFNTTGTRHIMAISGMNITIISQIILSFFLALGLWRYQAFIFSIIILFLFIVMVGAPASVVRAGIMAGALLTAENIGRPKNETRAVLYAALIMLFLNPLLLRLDIGFQLSFLAIIGIIYFGRYIKERLLFLPDILGLRDAAAMTIAAQIATFPILIYNFGRISLVSIPANILIVPLLPLLMIGGFISGLAGIFIEKIGQILSWPVWLILTYITSIIDFFVSLPFASMMTENAHWFWIVPYYLILFWFWRRFVQNRMLENR